MLINRYRISSGRCAGVLIGDVAMSEPLNRVLILLEPLKESEPVGLRAQQTFSEAESRTFAPAAIDERPEDEGAR